MKILILLSLFAFIAVAHSWSEEDEKEISSLIQKRSFVLDWIARGIKHAAHKIFHPVHNDDAQIILSSLGNDTKEDFKILGENIKESLLNGEDRKAVILNALPKLGRLIVKHGCPTLFKIMSKYGISKQLSKMFFKKLCPKSADAIAEKLEQIKTHLDKALDKETTVPDES